MLWSSSLTSPNGDSVTYVIDPSSLPHINIVRTYQSSGYEFALTLGPDSTTVFGSSGYAIDRYTAAGVTTVTSLPPHATLFNIDTNITVGSSSELWAAGEVRPSKMPMMFRFDGNFSSSSVFPLPDNFFSSNIQNYLAAGSDGNIWFTDATNNRVGEITEDGKISYVPIPVANRQLFPVSLVSAPDGNLYFLDSSNSNLVRINPVSKAVATTPLPFPLLAGDAPFLPTNPLAVGPDGNLWLSDLSSSNPAVIRSRCPRPATPLRPRPRRSART